MLPHLLLDVKHGVVDIDDVGSHVDAAAEGGVASDDGDVGGDVGAGFDVDFNDDVGAGDDGCDHC